MFVCDGTRAREILEWLKAGRQDESMSRGAERRDVIVKHCSRTDSNFIIIIEINKGENTTRSRLSAFCGPRSGFALSLTAPNSIKQQFK